MTPEEEQVIQAIRAQMVELCNGFAQVVDNQGELDEANKYIDWISEMCVGRPVRALPMILALMQAAVQLYGTWTGVDPHPGIVVIQSESKLVN